MNVLHITEENLMLKLIARLLVSWDTFLLSARWRSLQIWLALTVVKSLKSRSLRAVCMCERNVVWLLPKL